MEPTGRTRIVIIGAGIAGASTAYFLARRGFHDIIILEGEDVAGSLSTGRNAAILRSAIPDPVLRRLARESARFYRQSPDGFSSGPLLNTVGLYLVARSEHSSSLVSWALDGEEEEGAKLVEPSGLYARVPILASGITTALHLADEGVLDVHAILQSFLSGACSLGAQLRLGCNAIRLNLSGGRVTGVETSEGRLDADQVVMAGGGWAAALSDTTGLPLPLVPYRRHLLVTNPLPQVDPRWPVVWCEGDEFYFRPESGGLLMCGCDTVAVSPEEGQKTDPAQIERIAAKAARWLPSLGDAGVARSWAGMRTFAPDHRFVIGPDPRVSGLHWAAGLGGHGITCAPAVGNLAAEWIAGENNHPAATYLLPARLL
jgi:glycine/D-amino acid oxidase-like deaminating enzyme